jgi:hypothetical protein
MASVTAIMNEVSGDCDEVLKVSVKFKGGQSWPCCEKKVKFFGAGKSFVLVASRRDSARYWHTFIQCFGGD